MNQKSTAPLARPLMAVALVSLLALTACGGAGWNPEAPTAAPATPSSEAAATVARFRAQYPSLAPYFEEARAYVVFPTVGKGGFWIGGARGTGEVYESGRFIGTATITQLTAGPQIGGQAYSEIIFLRDEAALRDFTAGNFELGAQVSAVALDEGGAHHAAYTDGVAVFALEKKGLMAEATVAGQKFDFAPAG